MIKRITNSKFSKIWLYIPIYTLVWSASVFGLHWYLNRPKAVEPKVETPKESKALQAFIRCFENNQSALDGIFSITPIQKLKPFLERMDSTCYEQICDDMKAGLDNPQSFYSKAEFDECLSPLLNRAIDYHKNQLSKHTTIALFYDAGKADLSKQQQLMLRPVLRIFKKTDLDAGLLIIGRASSTGSTIKNKALSKDRAKNIVRFVEREGINNLKHDFIYFGADPPQLTQRFADALEIDESAYRNINFGKGKDAEYKLRLNQSVLLVIYPREEDTFGLENLGSAK